MLIWKVSKPPQTPRNPLTSLSHHVVFIFERLRSAGYFSTLDSTSYRIVAFLIGLIGCVTSMKCFWWLWRTNHLCASVIDASPFIFLPCLWMADVLYYQRASYSCYFNERVDMTKCSCMLILDLSILWRNKKKVSILLKRHEVLVLPTMHICHKVAIRLIYRHEK